MDELTNKAFQTDTDCKILETYICNGSDTFKQTFKLQTDDQGLGNKKQM